MSTPIQNIVAPLQDRSHARIKLTFAGGHQHHYDCIYKADSEDTCCFYLRFEENTLPETIDQGIEHPVSILGEEKTVSLNVSISDQIDKNTLYVKAKGTLDPSSLREYFRVNTSTQITASYKTNSQSATQTSWSLDGQTMDLSASGVLALLPEEPKHREHIILEIFLPHENLTVNAVSHIVHKKRLRNRRWLVAFHFDTISTKHRDSVITYLLGEQRRQLRENIHTNDLE